MIPGGGVDLAIAEQGYDTFRLLEQLQIPYHEPPGWSSGHNWDGPLFRALGAPSFCNVVGFELEGWGIFNDFH